MLILLKGLSKTVCVICAVSKTQWPQRSKMSESRACCVLFIFCMCDVMRNKFFIDQIKKLLRKKVFSFVLSGITFFFLSFTFNRMAKSLARTYSSPEMKIRGKRQIEKRVWIVFSLFFTSNYPKSSSKIQKFLN